MESMIEFYQKNKNKKETIKNKNNNIIIQKYNNNDNLKNQTIFKKIVFLMIIKINF